MVKLFLGVLKLSFSASFLVLAVLAARMLLRKAPKGMICALWALVALRLLCPFSIESRMSLVPQTPLPHRDPIAISVPQAAPASVPAVTPDVVPTEAPAEVMTIPEGNVQSAPVTAERPHTPEVANTPPPAKPVDLWGPLGAAVWVVGCTGMLGYALISFLKIRRQTAASIQYADGIYLCDHIGSPFLLGIFRPKIYLPSDLSPEEAQYVLAHEKMHLKWKDHWWKPLGFILLAFHWFNPLMWVAYMLLCRDIESACDQRVIRTLSHRQQAHYAETLLSCSLPRHLSICPVAFGESNVKRRIQDVLHYKKPSFLLKALALIALVIVALCFATMPNQHTLLELSGVQQLSRLSVDFGKTRLRLSHPEDLNACFDMLEKVRCTPVSVTEKPASDNSDQVVFSLDGSDELVEFTFSPDFKTFSVKERQNTTATYAVKDPQLIQEFLDTQGAPIIHQEISGAPYADLYAPWTWTSRLNLHQITQARCTRREPSYYIREVRMEGDNIDGYCTKPRAEELISVLNGLEPQAFAVTAPPKGRTAKELMEVSPESKTVSVTLDDPMHEIVAILQYDSQTVKLLFSPDAAEFSRQEAGDKPLSGLSAWKIQDEALLSCMEAFLHHPSVVEEDTELAPKQPHLVQASADGFTLTLTLPEDWEYRMISRTTPETAFGIRCRPYGETRGWLSYLCVPDFGGGPNTEPPEGYTLLGRFPQASRALILKPEETEYWTVDYGAVIDTINKQAAFSIIESPSLTELVGLADPLSIGIVAEQQNTTLWSAAFCNDFCQKLEAIRCDTTPVETHIPIGSTSDYSWDGTRIVLDDRSWDGGRMMLGFRSDFQYLYLPEMPFVKDGPIPYVNVYRVQNPQALSAIIDAYLDPVVGETTSGNPYANLSAPWTWTRDLKLSQLEEVRFTNGPENMSLFLSGRKPFTGYFSRTYAQKLIERLNALSQEDFIPVTPSRNCTAEDLLNVEYREPGIGGHSVLLQDPVHEIAALLQYDAKTVRLVISPNPQAFTNHSPQILTDLTAWEVHDEALLELMGYFSSRQSIIAPMPQMHPADQ